MPLVRMGTSSLLFLSGNRSMTEWNDESRDLLDDLIQRLEDAWRSGGEVDLAQLVATVAHPLRNAAWWL